MSTVMGNFDTWKKFLGDRVAAAKRIGISEESINKLSVEIGEFLSHKVDPKNDEERVLKELWDVCDESERRTMAGAMMKLAERNA